MGNDRLAVVGAAAVQERPRRRRLDELVFEASRAALHEAGVAASEVGFSSISSLDLYDGRSISNGIISPAAAGYLTSEMRIELDSSSALMAAIATIHARQTELALVVAVHAPETTALTSPQLRSFTDKVSSYTFDPHFTRPLGLCATSALALHAAAAIEDGRTSREAMAAAAAAACQRRSKIRPRGGAKVGHYGARLRPPGGRSPSGGLRRAWRFFEGFQPAFRARLWARR